MTGYSASIDETGKVFDTPRPGYLADVFGIRVGGFYRTDMEWAFSEGTERKEEEIVKEILRVKKDVVCDDTQVEGRYFTSQTEWLGASYYEVLEPQGADIYAYFEGKDIPAVTVNRYGKGKAYYVAAESDGKLIGWLLEQITDELGLKRGLLVPEGIQAREIADNQYFYVNTLDREMKIPLMGKGRGVLTGLEYDYELILKARESELIILQIENERNRGVMK